MQGLGAPPEAVQAAREQMQREAAEAAAAKEELVLYEDIVDSVRVFEAMRTQWERAGADGVKVAINYSRLPVVMRGLRLDPDDGERFAVIFEDIRVMEDEALKVITERSP
jgi:hypothetical protein